MVRFLLISLLDTKPFFSFYILSKPHGPWANADAFFAWASLGPPRRLRGDVVHGRLQHPFASLILQLAARATEGRQAPDKSAKEG